MFYLVQIFDSLRHDGLVPVAFASRNSYANALAAVELLSAEYQGKVTDSKVEAIYETYNEHVNTWLGALDNG